MADLPAGRTGIYDYLLQMNYYVYALRSLNRNYIYVGITNNVTRRVQEHNSGQVRTTKPYSPFKIIYFKATNNRPTARHYEKYLKSGTGKEFLKTMV